MLADPYKHKVLIPEVHDRLVKDLETYAKDAGIQPRFIYEPLPEMVTDQERDYLRNFRRHLADPGVCSGLLYVGKKTREGIEDRFSAIAGALTRNFLRAKVMTLGAVLDNLHSHTMPDVSCLLIPNFFYDKSEGGIIAPWQVSALLDYLTERHVSGVQTLLYASNLETLKNEYGLGFKHLLAVHYQSIGGA